MDRTNEKEKTETRHPVFKEFRQIPEMKRKACFKFKGLKQKKNREAIRKSEMKLFLKL
jgi:hypothetical protein